MQVAHVLGTLGVIGNAREDILRDARNAANPDWITEGVDRQVSALIEYERSATRMVCVAPLFPPGMLQTEGTANAVVAGDAERRGEEVDDNQVRSIVAARMAPQRSPVAERPHAARRVPRDAGDRKNPRRPRSRHRTTSVHAEDGRVG
ncbi:Scr1 family TA system antitoxin-like transcriptional regulator [Amycolatopsis methanolica]|uniref:Scr1 family TA system antitoxin-like transcriptional regulator n=1 Tax=Amycolatopsis methanolica TaxID=1814 RepID=UPI000B25D0B1